MDAAWVVLQKTGIMFLVMLAGGWSRRRGWLVEDVTRGLSRFVVDLAFPALVFTQLLRTVTVPALQAGWWVPLLSAVVILGSAAIGRVGARVARVAPESRRTFIFLVAVPNWVFLPLLIADALYGAEGVRFVLLFNMGAQIVLWTEGVRMLHGRPVGRDALRGLLGNVGLMATLAGILVALAWPGAAVLCHPAGGSGGLRAAGETVMGALQMLGDLTIPLSLLVTGAQLGRRPNATAADVRALAGVIVCRLLVAPVVLLALAQGLALAGWRMPETSFITLAVIVAMPVAISCTMFVDRFGGDRALSAAGIFYTTLLSLVSVPVVVLVCRALL
jgi:predicted permease